MNKILSIVAFVCFSFTAFSQKNYHLADSIGSAAKGVTVESLHSQLTMNLKSDEEKLRSFYFWITHNIVYDIYEWSHPSNNIEKQRAASVLKNKKAVCHGYSELFKSFCDLSAIPCFLVSGYPKKNNELVSEGHTWNVVFVNEKWFPIDATWGAGVIDGGPKFVKEFDEAYFLPQPAKFLEDHYPFDPMWQLVTNPVSVKNYKKHGWQHNESGTVYFNFNDTIKNWLLNEETMRKVTSAQRMNRFNPDDPESKTELAFALISWSYAESSKGTAILDELYPKKNNQRTTTSRKQLPQNEFNLQLQQAYSHFSTADSILSKVKSVDRNQQQHIDATRKGYDYNMKTINSVLNK
jgi:hypothetical protein